MKIKAELLPLIGKYYETKIKLTVDDDRAQASSFWNMLHLNLRGDHTPSERELKNDPSFISEDSHYETQLTYEVACALIEKINKE